MTLPGDGGGKMAGVIVGWCGRGDGVGAWAMGGIIYFFCLPYAIGPFLFLFLI
jgi:hypothetical protein